MKYLSLLGLGALLFAANAQANSFAIHYECEFDEVCEASGTITHGDNLTLTNDVDATMEVKCDDKKSQVAFSDDDAELKKHKGSLIIRGADGDDHASIKVKDFFHAYNTTQPESKTFDASLRVNRGERLHGSCTFSQVTGF